jgi:UDP-glucuronate 4-epimerase
MRMRILVTGAGGFIGSNLTESLTSSGFEVVGSDPFDEILYPKEIKMMNISKSSTQCKLLSEAEIDAVDMNAIVHLGALPGLVQRSDAPRLYIEKNLLGTLDSLELAKKNRVKKYVYVSTSSVYGKSGIGDETLKVNPISNYGLSKSLAEKLVIKFCSDEGINFTILRLFSVFGPRQRPDMAIHKILTSLILDREFNVYSSLDSIRSNTFVFDVCNAIIASLQSTSSGQIYNISGDEEISLRTWIDMAENLVGKKLQLKVTGPREGDQLITSGNAAKAKNELGFKNSISPEAGLNQQFMHIKRHLEFYESAL